MATVSSSKGILAEGAREERERIIEMLKRAYWVLSPLSAQAGGHGLTIAPMGQPGAGVLV